jgi:hypothetical protein
MQQQQPRRALWVIGRTAVVALIVLVMAGGSLTTTSAKAPLAATEDDESSGFDLLDIDPANFDNPTVIDNEWMPLKPGHRLIYEGYTVQDGERIPHIVIETVTDLTKVINGVRTRVSLEEDYSDEELVEKEIAFHAQDNDGNVWHLGQLVETYEGEILVGGRVWLVGLTEGAHAGIRMPAEPKVGDVYSQGYAPPPFFWTDRGMVYQVGQKTTVRAGSFDDVVIIAEWDEETEEGVFQDKYYARGVGVVRVGFRGPDPDQEELELVAIEELSPEELADVRLEVMRMEERAYLYGRTSPVEQG